MSRTWSLDIVAGTKAQIDARLADQPTAEAGSDNTKLLTPLRTKQSITVNAELATFTPDGTGAVARSIRDKLREICYSVVDYGAVADGKAVIDGAISASSSTFTSATAEFVPSDVGKLISVLGAGAAGATLITTISGYTNGTTVTLTGSASTTVTAARSVFGTDCTAGIQKAINAAARQGGTVFVPATGRDYLITSELVAKISTDDLLPGQTGYQREGDINRINFASDGATITAMAPMSNMLRYTYDTSDSDFSPASSLCQGLRFNGNNLVDVGIFSEWTINLIFDENLMVWGAKSIGIDVQGYGVAHFRDIYVRAPICISVGRAPNYGGGDSIFESVDLYPSQTGIFLGAWSGNTRITGKTVMTRDYGVVGDNVWGVVIDAQDPVDGSKQANDIIIDGVEWRGMKGVKGRRAAAARNIYNVSVDSCHTNFWDYFGYATIADLDGVDDARLVGNFLGYGIGADVAGVGFILKDCRRVSVQGNRANNLTNEFATLLDCVDCSIDGRNILRNVNKSNAAGSAITVSASGAGGLTLRNRIADNKAVQTSGSYAQTFVTEGSNCDYTALVNNELTGFTTEAVLAGTNSFRATLGPAGTASGAVRHRFGGSARFATPGGDVLFLLDVLNAVNGIQMRGAATGNVPVLEAIGSDTDVWLSLAAKGAGILQLLSHTRMGTGKFLQRTQATGLVAVGASQGAALLLTSDLNEVATVAAGTGVRLDGSQREVFIANSGANALKVYPQTGAAINALAANAPFSLAAGAVARCVAVSSTKWFAS